MDDEKINQLSLYEQNIQQLLAQRQSMQSQLIETESAIKESSNSKEVYKIIGNIMVLSEKDSIIEELSDKKKMLEIRISSIEKQEKNIKSKAEELQKEIITNMKNTK